MINVPGKGLGIVQIKIGEKFSVIEMPKARGIVSHRIIDARNIVFEGEVSVEALVQRVETQEGGGWGGGGNGPPPIPK